VGGKSIRDCVLGPGAEKVGMESLFGMMGMVMLATMFNFAEEGKGGQEKIEDQKKGDNRTS
jgi:hypothetical protein